MKIDNADWVSSEVLWNLDQAHKMLGMLSDGDVNVITVPVSYWKRNQTKDWWYENYQTAVGIMSWDLALYDPARKPAQQSVIQNHGTFIHPNGEVRRSVLFTHQTSKQRMMANLSDTHISLANIQNLDAPRLESVVEVAPYLNELFRFGNFIVEEVQPRTDNNWYAERSAVEFRVKAAGGDIDGKAPIATFVVGQVERAVKHGNQLVVFRYLPGQPTLKSPNGVPVEYGPPKSEAVIYDLSDPSKPILAGRVDVPQESFPYYRFYCGDYWGGYWFGNGYWGGATSWADTTAGLVVVRQWWDPMGTTSGWKLLFLDLRSATAPRVTERNLAIAKDTYVNNLSVDTIDGRGFYLGYRKLGGQVKRDNGAIFYQWKDYAARWELDGDTWVQRSALNVPGNLIRTFRSADNERLLLTSDYDSRWLSDPVTKQGTWVSWTRLSLLREIQLNGRDVAERLDARIFDNLQLAGLVADGDKIFVNGRRGYAGPYFAGGGVAVSPGTKGVASPAGGAAVDKLDLSDRLMAFDLAGKKLNLVYDQSTRMYNVDLMGVHQGRLFANLAGDGILVVDVSTPAAPKGLHFERTLGYATHIEFAGNDVYVGSGFFGTTHIDLAAAGSLNMD